MIKIMIVPNRYIQGPGILDETGKYINHLGSKAFVIGGSTALATVKDRIGVSLDRNSMPHRFEIFSGE
jgi:glycerol dehydrogenase